MSTENDTITCPGGMEMPAPTKEHAWLQKFVGEWETECEIFMAPDQPPMKSKGKEVTKSIGGFWILGQSEGQMEDMPTFHSVLTLGYDPAIGKYVGSWIDSMTSYIWRYEGTVNEAGTTLSLDTEGPCPINPDCPSKFKEVTEFVNDDHRIFSSSIQGPDGNWTKMVVVNSRRKK